MKQKITKNDLIRYIYKETSITETLAITEAISRDWELFEEYEVLMHSFQLLPKVKFDPSAATIQGILSYSQNSARLIFK